MFPNYHLQQICIVVKARGNVIFLKIKFESTENHEVLIRFNFLLSERHFRSGKDKHH